MPTDYPTPQGYGNYGQTSWLSQQEGQKVSSMALHLPTSGDDPDTGAAVE